MMKDVNELNAEKKLPIILFCLGDRPSRVIKFGSRNM